MTTSRYREFFRSLSELVTLYVGLLALIGLLASVGFFKLRIEPSVKVLEPTYGFDMPQLIKAFEVYSHGVPCPEEWRNVSNQFATFRKPLKAQPSVVPAATLPFQEPSTACGTHLPIWVKPSNPADLFYTLGFVEKPATFDTQAPNFSAKRSDDLKRYGVGMAIAIDWGRLATEKGLGKYDYRLKENPLAKFQEIIPPRDPRQEHPEFLSDGLKLDHVTQATYVYSIVSVANYSSQPLEGVKLSVPNLLMYGPITLVGWSDVPQSVDSVEKSEGYHITIERLEPLQSIEIVFRGHKLLRETGICVSSSWNYDKVKIGTWMFIMLALVVALYYGDVLATKAKQVLRSSKAH